jgi:hypothetical protein
MAAENWPIVNCKDQREPVGGGSISATSSIVGAYPELVHGQ